MASEVQYQSYCGPRAAILFVLLYVCITLPHESLAGYNEKKLLHKLLDHYNVLERPVANESDPLQLSFGLTLMQIIDV
ncbi:nAChRa7, partial [Trypoxylus dichotomus]